MIRAMAAWLLSVAIGLAAVAPAASATQINPDVQIAALACASTGSCSAVGAYNDGLGEGQVLLVSERAGRWQQAVEAQAPAGAAADPFKLSDGGGVADISCPAAGDCSAIGRYTDSHRTDHGVAFTETHGSWRRGTALRLPANAVTPKHPKSGVVDDLGLAAISCSSVGNCVAVGNYETNAEVWEAMIVVERHGRWQRAIEAPLPAGAPIDAQNAVLLAVTCSHSGLCSAAGEYIDPSGHQQPLLVSGDGSSWSTAAAPAPPAGANSDPKITPVSIDCAGAGQCAAVGTYINPLQNSLGLLLSETGGSWAAATGTALPAGAAPAGTAGDQTTVLASVACPQVGACTAVGWYDDNEENSQGLLVTQEDGIWQPGAEIALPANATRALEKQSAGLDWISCTSTGNCLATGTYTDIGYNAQGLLLSESDGVWQTGLESPLPRNASTTTQYAAADQSDCTGVGDCAVIGQYDDTGGNVLGYVLSETNGTWGQAAELALPAASRAEVRLSLAAILAPSGRSATLRRIRAAQEFVYTYQAVAPGTARVSWYASRGGRRVLIATGDVRVATPGSDKLKLRLTAAGSSVLAGATHVRVSAVARFKPRARQSVQLETASFTLR